MTKETTWDLPEFAESINMHGSRMASKKPTRRKAKQKKRTLETVLNILLVTLCILVALMIISIAMAGFSFATYRLASLIL